jgi:hypothetical protein
MKEVTLGMLCDSCRTAKNGIIHKEKTKKINLREMILRSNEERKTVFS